MRRAAKVDDNQGEIVRVLRQFGVSVEHLHAIGRGVPDLLCGYRGLTHLLEVKDGSRAPSERRLTPDQQRWHASWRGRKPVVVESVDDALSVVGILHSADSA